ncbi:MAG: hypothetical protein QOC81_1862 [Thermoanaerobaculia bacterium]|jgi:hypothetical protein|nr:hypothetical protein [Thermoanaerobaculia bacterium]
MFRIEVDTLAPNKRSAPDLVTTRLYFGSRARVLL